MSIILKMIYGIRHLRILGKMKLACVQRQPKLQVTMNKLENFLKGVLIKSLIHLYVLRLSCFNVQKKTLIWKTTTTTNKWLKKWNEQMRRSTTICQSKQNIGLNQRSHETMCGNFKQYCSNQYSQLLSTNTTESLMTLLNEPAINGQITRQNKKF